MSIKHQACFRADRPEGPDKARMMGAFVHQDKELSSARREGVGAGAQGQGCLMLSGSASHAMPAPSFWPAQMLCQVMLLYHGHVKVRTWGGAHARPWGEVKGGGKGAVSNALISRWLSSIAASCCCMHLLLGAWMKMSGQPKQPSSLKHACKG